MVEIEQKLQTCQEDLEKNKNELISSLETSSDYENLFSVCVENKKTLLEKLELQEKQSEVFKKIKINKLSKF